MLTVLHPGPRCYSKSGVDLRLSFHPEAMRGVSRKSFRRKKHPTPFLWYTGSPLHSMATSLVGLVGTSRTVASLVAVLAA